MQKEPETASARTPTPIRVLIADDHPVFRHGLRMLIQAEPGLEVVGEAVDGEEAIRLATKLRPDILLLDLAMPRLTGIEALRQLAGAEAPCRTILLTAEIDRAGILEALQLGAHGVILKDASTEILLKGIRGVMSGGYWIGREGVSDLIRCLREHGPDPGVQRQRFGLTPRELQVVEAVVTGDTNKDIAKRLSVTEDTVKHHLSSIFDKVGVFNRLELALFAINHGLVDSDKSA